MVCINRCNSGKCIYAFNRNDCRSLKEKRKNEERRYENEICKNSLRRYSGRGDGITYPHEHLYAVPPTCQKDRDLEVSDYEGSVAELKLFKSVGGQTLVEASTLDYGRNLSLLKKMSEETGVHVIATTGFNKHIYYPNWVEEKKYRRNFRYSRRRYFGRERRNQSRIHKNRNILQYDPST